MIKVQQISKADYGVVDSPKKKCSIIELLNAVAAYQFQIQSEKKFSFRSQNDNKNDIPTGF